MKRRTFLTALLALLPFGASKSGSALCKTERPPLPSSRPLTTTNAELLSEAAERWRYYDYDTDTFRTSGIGLFGSAPEGAPIRYDVPGARRAKRGGDPT